ncbi:UNVERIFIED_CONTAM: hypothetical protein FKN15_049962 [Acipenser sinensis]
MSGASGKTAPTVAGWQTMTLLSFDGTTSWEVFHAQLVVLGRLCSWSEEDKAQQLTTALREDAQMVLLNLAEEEMGGCRPPTLVRQYWGTRAAASQILEARAGSGREPGSAGDEPGEGSQVKSPVPAEFTVAGGTTRILLKLQLYACTTNAPQIVMV